MTERDPEHVVPPTDAEPDPAVPPTDDLPAGRAEDAGPSTLDLDEPPPDPVTGPAPDPVTESAPDPMTESAPVPMTESAPVPMTESRPDPDPATATEPRGFLARRSAARVQATQNQRPWRRYLVLAVVGVVVAVVAFILITSLLPIWWAGTVGRQAGGTLTGGIGWGVFYGFVFTFLPLLVASLAFARRWKSVGTRLVIIVVGVLLAVPNLITLGVTVGTGSSAHAAERTLDVQAPLFARTVLISAVVAAVLAAVVWVLSFLRRRAVTELKRLRAESEVRGQLAEADLRASRQATRAEEKAARARARGRS